jgi:hypothetical protein
VVVALHQHLGLLKSRCCAQHTLNLLLLFGATGAALAKLVVLLAPSGI